MHKKLNYHSAAFFLAAATLEQMPSDHGAEVAFIGRSNAGKSSALNAITGIKGLARTSKTPGRTQTINFFALDTGERLVDLPGYGYAKVPIIMRERWHKTVNSYLMHRVSLRGLVVVMDVRHPMKELDHEIIEWATQAQIPVHILLTKADKLSHGSACATLQQVQQSLGEFQNKVGVQLFSSLERTGLQEVIQVLNHWFSV